MRKMDVKVAKRILRICLDGGINVLFVGAVAWVVWVLAQVFVFSSYYIPTASMYPALHPGDYVWVNKLAYGARLFDLEAAAKGKPFEMRRTWGYDRVRRNDVVVFNNPKPHRRNKIEFDLMKYYVKRCIALPGDSLVIRQGRYQVLGCAEELGNVAAQDEVWHISMFADRKIPGLSMRAFPKWRVFGWTILEFGPLYIPSKGDVLSMDERHYWLYRQLIAWETGQEPVLQSDGTVWLGHRRLSHYTFAHNYYFMAGDNVANSDDSRYWGLVPDDFIAGRVGGIWQSKDIYTGKQRWGRVGWLD